MADTVKALSVGQLLDGSAEYVIPMYQRNYAWEEAEITQLIQDVIDCMPEVGRDAKSYYIGTLVVFQRKATPRPVFETIDGQQRLTTLSLLTCYLKKSLGRVLPETDAPCLSFDSRENSRSTLEAIFAAPVGADPSEGLREQQINSAILHGYRLISKILPHKLQMQHRSLNAFARFLLDSVQIMRVKVPDDTDLNHYFEIMNTRGEQLEKHEVLKAQLMEKLGGCAQSENCLHRVWEACANMERYVQLGFAPQYRAKIFVDEESGGSRPIKFEKLSEILAASAPSPQTSQNAEPGSHSQTLKDILKQRPVAGTSPREADETPERFHAVTNFPNFLLHVLRVVTREDIGLDDKGLLSAFEKHIFRQPDPAAGVKTFIGNMLRCRYLLDRYVIKREFVGGADDWSLKRLKTTTEVGVKSGSSNSYVNTFGHETVSDLNRRILMLQAAFHVSAPTQSYKHWLNAALLYLFKPDQIDGNAYLHHLETVAISFMFDRYLVAPAAARDYFSIIYQSDGTERGDRAARFRETGTEFLQFSKIQNNFVFNFLDYALWKKMRLEDPVINRFKFTFRSSVEHYYPQQPMGGIAPLKKDLLDSFGNLCLISNSKNSKLSNYMPVAKKEHYGMSGGASKSAAIDSVKQYLMMLVQDEWNEVQISLHYENMIVEFLELLEVSESSLPASPSQDALAGTTH